MAEQPLNDEQFVYTFHSELLPSQVEGFMRLQADMDIAARDFEGYRGQELSCQENQADGLNHCTVKICFTSLEYCLAWLDSSVRRNLLFHAEDAIGYELSDLLLIEAHQVRTRIQVAPIFSGIALHVQVSCQQEPLLEEVATMFQEAPDVDYRQQLPNLRSLMGDADLVVGRIAINPWIRGVELQAQVDNVTYSVQNGLRMLQQYHQAELL